MPQAVSDLAKNIITDYYDSLADIAANEAINVRFTAQLDYQDLAMIDAISSRFSDTRTNLVQEILANMVMELFLSIPDAEKSHIAEVATANAKSYEEKNRIESHGLNKWEHMVETIKNKLEGTKDA